MRNLIIGSILVALIVVAALLLYFYPLNRNEADGVSTENFTVLIEEGTVQYKNKKDDTYTEINTEDTELISGSFVKTNESSFAQIILPNNSIISIDQNTEIQIDIESSEHTKIDQLVGNTWHRVKTLTETDSYDVKTPNTIASVRGTIFAVEVANDLDSSIFVEDSKVEVSRYTETGNETTQFDTVELSIGDLVEVKDASALLVTKLPENRKTGYWYLRNKKLDESIYNKLDTLDLKSLRDILDKDSINNYNFSTGTDSSLRTAIPGLANLENYDSDYNYADFCSYFDGSDYYLTEEYWSTLDTYFDASYSSLLKEYFSMLSVVCTDGVVDSSEWEKLLELGKKFENIDYDKIYKINY